MIERNLKKRAKVLINAQTLVDIFKQDDKTRCFKVNEGLPSDSIIIGALFDPTRDIWEIAVSSETFREVEDYEVLPELPCIVTTTVYYHKHEEGE